MKFSATLLVLSTVTGFAAAAIPHHHSAIAIHRREVEGDFLIARADDTLPVCDDECDEAEALAGYSKNGRFSQPCLNLVNDCLTKAESTDYIFSKTSCVAAATCKGTTQLKTLLACRRPNLKVNALSDLSTNIFAEIVGTCKNCPMSQQNYIDLFFRSLAAIKTAAWPSGEEVMAYWSPIQSWTATGATIPYKNFNDWLKYASTD